MGKCLDRTGHVYGRLTVVSRQANDIHGRARWNCRCECGEVRVVRSSNLGGGRVRSCGCSRFRNGHSKAEPNTPEVTAWISMRNRCTRPKHVDYPDYGGRGITICERWSSVELFLSDMGPRPSRSHSLDRIDNLKGYHPGNVRWATWSQQNNNRRSTKWIAFGGRNMTQTQWSFHLGGSKDLVSKRLAKGWTKEKAVTTPAGQRRTPIS